MGSTFAPRNLRNVLCRRIPDILDRNPKSDPNWSSLRKATLPLGPRKGLRVRLEGPTQSLFTVGGLSSLLRRASISLGLVDQTIEEQSMIFTIQPSRTGCWAFQGPS